MLYSKLGDWVSHCNGCVKFKLKFNFKSLNTTKIVFKDETTYISKDILMPLEINFSIVNTVG